MTGKVVVYTTRFFLVLVGRSSAMSRKDDQKRKKRELKKKESRKAEDARRLQCDPRTIVNRLKELFNEDAQRAISYALNDDLSDEDIAKRLEVPIERVTELLDLAGQLPDRIIEYFRRYPEAMSNPKVLKAIVQGVRQRGF